MLSNVDKVRKSLQRFGAIDYVVFIVMLTSCALIGVYFAYKMGRKARKELSATSGDAEKDYLVGGRNMKLFPITMSLISSFISGITLLGTPTEVYLYGTQYLFVVGSIFLMGLIMHKFFLPVFHDLQLISTYQYLESRFDRRVRLLGSVLFIFGTMLWLPIVIYVPALAFNQATGINIHIITPMVSLVCIFYTCIGGLKAVVWTDVVQTIIMLGAMLLIIVKGTIDIGGPGMVFRRAKESGRLELPSLAFDLTERHTIYSLFIGGTIHWLKSNAINQNMIQRYLSLPTLRKAQQAIWSFIIGVTTFLIICGYSGLLIYATYSHCDPLETKLAKQKDQLLPLLVMDTLGNIPGLTGLFVAGVFSAALSSLSTGLNSMSAVILEDFFKIFSRRALTAGQTAIILRVVVIIFGALCVGLVFIVERLGTVLQLSITLSSVANGPLLGIFTAGVMIPWIEGVGALSGGISSLLFMAWMCINAQLEKTKGIYPTQPRKYFTTNGCNYTFTEMTSTILNTDLLQNNIEKGILQEGSSFSIYHISYLYYTLTGALIAIIVALIVSFCIGSNDPKNVNKALLSPFVRRWLDSDMTKRDSNIMAKEKEFNSSRNCKILETET